jgi:predicted esterase
MIRPILAALLLLSGLASAQEYGDTIRLKVRVGEQSRKIALFLPKGLRKGEKLPLLVAVPNEQCKAFMEIGQWQVHAHEERFAVFSVDTITGTRNGWHHSERLEMERDMEAVLSGMEVALEEAKKRGATLDLSATVITGWSGGCYLAAWLGLRRPDMFLGVCLRGPVYHKETVQKLEKPDLDQRIYIYRGEIDNPRVIEQAATALKTIKERGFKQVSFRVVPKADHKSMPEVCVEWYQTLLKETAKGRAEAHKIAQELVKVKEAIDKKRAGAYGKLAKLVEREKRAGFSAGAVALMTGVLAAAEKEYKRAEDLDADTRYDEAIDVLKRIERTYSGLPIAKKARARGAQIRKSDNYKAAELLAKAKAYKEKGKDVKAADLFEKIVTKYPDTPAAEEAAHLLKS